ncbi:MAG TPA: hypothetical protein VK629_17565 [Steroidobacteraceae bacterium]|nr:hypothetical protein [Steroidobacteraceae bacterium]
MSMVSFYKLDTGLFTGVFISANDRVIAANCKEGESFIAGRYDRKTHRVDIATGKVVAYQPPADEVTAEQKLKADKRARAELDEIDRRAVRYLMDELAGNLDSEGRRRLDAMCARKVELRGKLLAVGRRRCAD